MTDIKIGRIRLGKKLGHKPNGESGQLALILAVVVAAVSFETARHVKNKTLNLIQETSDSISSSQARNAITSSLKLQAAILKADQLWIEDKKGDGSTVDANWDGVTIKSTSPLSLSGTTTKTFEIKSCNLNAMDRADVTKMYKPTGASFPSPSLCGDAKQLSAALTYNKIVPPKGEKKSVSVELSAVVSIAVPRASGGSYTVKDITADARVEIKIPDPCSVVGPKVWLQQSTGDVIVNSRRGSSRIVTEPTKVRIDNVWIDYPSLGPGGSLVICGDDGVDDITNWGYSGKVKIYGFAGDDYIAGSWGGGYIDGGEGDDRILVSAATKNDNWVIFGRGGKDRIESGPGDDFIFGGDGGDTINSGNGNDFVYGEGGNDTITEINSRGRRFICGGTGSDSIWPGGGPEILSGGPGGDRFKAARSAADTRIKIGGSGMDSFELDGGADIYITGTTIYEDENTYPEGPNCWADGSESDACKKIAQLDSILNQWREKYSAGLDCIRNGGSGCINGDNYLRFNETVFHDLAGDKKQGLNNNSLYFRTIGVSGFNDDFCAGVAGCWNGSL
jgi:hypothetical protein